MSSFLLTFVCTWVISEMNFGCLNQSRMRSFSEPEVTYLAKIAGQQTKVSPHLCLFNAVITDMYQHDLFFKCVLGTEHRSCGAGIFTPV